MASDTAMRLRPEGLAVTTGARQGHTVIYLTYKSGPPWGYAPLPPGGAGSAEFQRRALLAGVWMAETVACGGGALNNGATCPILTYQERPPWGYAPLPLGGAGSAEFQRRALLAGLWMAETVACGGGALNNGALAPISDLKGGGVLVGDRREPNGAGWRP
jgi:hypothetical protein